MTEELEIVPRDRRNVGVWGRIPAMCNVAARLL